MMSTEERHLSKKDLVAGAIHMVLLCAGLALLKLTLVDDLPWRVVLMPLWLGPAILAVLVSLCGMLMVGLLFVASVIVIVAKAVRVRRSS